MRPQRSYTASRACRATLHSGCARFPVWLFCSVLLLVLACEPASTPSRHILLISVDTLRADHLGAYGHPLELTPEIDALAAEGVLFERAYAPASYTLPSIGALLTGRYPGEIGIQVNQHRLADDVPTLATILQERGWRTGAVVYCLVRHATRSIRAA